MAPSRQIEQLPSALFEHYREEEQYHFDKTMPPGILIPRQLGRACLMRLNGEKSKANRTVKMARSGAKNFSSRRPKPPMVERFSIEMMAQHYGDYVIHADNLTALQRSRENQRKLELERLDHSLRGIEQAPKSRERSWLGYINELTVQALLNRGARHDMAGLPALTHHDRGAVDSMNYDVLALLSRDDTDTVTAHKLQVKSSASHAQSAEGKFQDDIVIVCAEDLLGYKSRTRRTSPKFPMAHYLLAEREGGSEALTRELDSATTALQQTALEQTVTLQPVA